MMEGSSRGTERNPQDTPTSLLSGRGARQVANSSFDSANGHHYLANNRIISVRNYTHLEDLLLISTADAKKNWSQTVQSQQGNHQHCNRQALYHQRVEAQRNLHLFNQESGSIELSAQLRTGSDVIAHNSRSNDAFRVHQDSQPSPSSQNVELGLRFSGNNSMDQLVSYHKQHFFRNSYSRQVLDASKVLVCNNFTEFIRGLASAEFPSSWELDKYIIPSKFKASASTSGRMHLESTRSEGISFSDCLYPEKRLSTFEEESASYRVKLPLKEPRYFPPLPSFSEENIGKLKRKMNQNYRTSKGKVPTSSSSKNIDNKDSPNAISCSTTYNSHIVPSTSVKTKFSTVGENRLCLPDSTVEEEWICKTETFIEEEDPITLCMPKIKYE